MAARGVQSLTDALERKAHEHSDGRLNLAGPAVERQPIGPHDGGVFRPQALGGRVGTCIKMIPHNSAHGLVRVRVAVRAAFDGIWMPGDFDAVDDL